MSPGENVSLRESNWNAGGWFGSQLGCTLWMILLSNQLASRDTLAAAACVAGFALLNLLGIILWRRRARMTMYRGIQLLLVAVALVVAVVVVLVRQRVPELYFPYWTLLVAPGLMLFMRGQRSNMLRKSGADTA